MDQPSRAEVVDLPPTTSPSPGLTADSGSTPSPPDPDRTPTRPDQDRPRVETEASIRTDAFRQLRGLRFALGCSVAIAVMVILTAINVQSGRILDREGHGWTFRVLFGPDVLSGINLQGWRVVSEPGQLSDPAHYTYLLQLFIAADFAFIIVYFFLLRAVIQAIARGFWRRLASWLLVALVAIDVTENLLSWPGLLDPPPVLIVIATALKWVRVVLLLAVLLLGVVTSPRSQDDERRITARLRRGWRAVMHQRFSFVPVLVLFILAVPSGAAILEQLPDALRRWISDDGRGVRQAIVSMVCTLGLSAFLIAAGWFRSGYAFRHPQVDPSADPPEDRRSPNLWVWLVGPAVALFGSVLAWRHGHGDDIVLQRLAAFFLLPVVVIVGSRLLRRRWRLRPTEYRSYGPPTFNERELTAVRLAGHIAGLGALTVGGLSLLRAYVPLLLVPGTAPLGRIWLFLLIGGAAVIVPWLVAMVVIWRVTDRRIRRLGAGKRVDRRTDREPDRLRGSWILLITAVGIFLLLGILPRLAAWIGLAATATLALGSIAGMLSAVGLLIQDRPTAEIFRVLRLQRSPLVSLLALTLVLVGLFGGKNTIHEVDRGARASSVNDTRLTMAESFRAWLDDPDRCVTTVGGRPVRPMLLVAAEGGGIRAAYWTVRGLQAIADTTCGERSALFSTGASGGSVGLTVARFSGTPDSPSSAEAVQAVKQMAAPGILSRAADGTFIRDLFYGASGVPVPRWTEPDPYVWKDRARLIEDGWAGTSGGDGPSWGDRAFLTPNDQLSPATGQLILNSSDVKHGCRVWVSQVSPGQPVAETEAASFDPERSCDKTPGPGARTIDLFSAYGPFVPGSNPETCLGDIRSVTAALLTARFPYVTPSAVIGPCPQVRTEDGKARPYWPRTQLVDGGYIENSGLATITDLSDDWQSLVRNHNAEILAQSSSTEPLVVPIVVFLSNGDRRVVQPALDSSPVSELVVPPLAYLRAGNSMTGSVALLERARAAVELDSFCPGTSAACTDVENHFPSRVVVVDRVTQPEIGAPLGWVMSQASINFMEEAMTKGQLDVRCQANVPARSGAYAPVQADRETHPSCRTGYATLGDLVRYYSTRS